MEIVVENQFKLSRKPQLYLEMSGNDPIAHVFGGGRP